MSTYITAGVVLVLSVLFSWALTLLFSNSSEDLIEGIITENETRATLNEGVRTYRLLAEERGKTIKLLMGQLKEIGEDYRKKCEEVKQYEEDINVLRLRLIPHNPLFKPVDAIELPLRVQRVAGFKVELDPLLSGDEMYLKNSNIAEPSSGVITTLSGRDTLNTRGSVKTGWGQEEGK